MTFFFPRIAGLDQEIFVRSVKEKLGDSYIVELQGTPFAQNLSDKIGNYLSRRRGSLTVSSVSIDLRTGRITADGTLSFELSINSVVELQKRFEKWSSDKKSSIETVIDGWTRILNSKNGDFSKIEKFANFEEVSDYVNKLRNQIKTNEESIKEEEQKIMALDKQLVDFQNTINTNSENLRILSKQYEDNRALLSTATAQETALWNQVNGKWTQYNELSESVTQLINRLNAIAIDIPVPNVAGPLSPLINIIPHF